MLRANGVLQELRVNAEDECCSVRAEGKFRGRMMFRKSSRKMLRVNAVLQELSANAEGECCSARAEGEC